jgi:hypothetical protein
MVEVTQDMEGQAGYDDGVWCVQTDLRVEAVHLRRFYNNFASVRSSVTPPLPVPGMATEAVLVETFEAGQPSCHCWCMTSTHTACI